MKPVRTLLSLILLLACLLHPGLCGAQLPQGAVKLGSRDLTPGARLSLEGEWRFKPGYAVARGETPESASPSDSDVPVRVPQLLSRVRWWLDDSADFEKFETARLKKLGFDTERADDGWYRVWVDAPRLPASRHLFLEFDGVAMRSRVYCNGHSLGEHTGMFSRFDFDLTPYLKAGPNLIAVYVSMEKIPPSTLSLGEAVTVNLTSSKILTLSKGMYGPLSPNQDNRSYDLYGIWQPVYLVMRDAAKIDNVWFSPTLEGARVQVEARSLSGAPPGAMLKAVWTDAKTGRPFASVGPVPVRMDTAATTTVLSLRGVKPQLWTPTEPHLYRLDVTLQTAAGGVLDRWTHRVGFRTFEARGAHCYLNGKPYWLRGANQLPYGKNPWDPALARKLIGMMHANNLRVTRTHATPWNEAWLDAADEIGLGVSIEGIRPWALAGKGLLPSPDIFQHWLMENADVVRRGRNHPSVLLWTVGNEMMLRDGKNLDKWRLLSQVVQQTRALDPGRPVIASSDYLREADYYQTALKPNGIDDGDIDDMHRYRGWYAESPFVSDSLFQTERERGVPDRPLIGQEMSTGYPDLDTGLPVAKYAKELVTPQAWVGHFAESGSLPTEFLEHHRAVTKRWAEQLRFQRGDRTAGFLLFSAECWFDHSYDAEKASPYPVVEAMRYAWSPIGLAWETARRRFHAGEQIATSVYVTNDDEQFRDLHDLRLRAKFVDESTGRTLGVASTAEIAALPYYRTETAPMQLLVPPVARPRQRCRLVVTLLQNGVEISRTVDRVEIFAPLPTVASISGAHFFASGLDSELTSIVRQEHEVLPLPDAIPASLAPQNVAILLGSATPQAQLAAGGKLRGWLEQGATAILFSPGKSVQTAFPDAIADTRTSIRGEYADFGPCAGTPLDAGLEPMDLKWWARKGDNRVFVADSAHRLQRNGPARELIRFIPPHSYIPAEKVPEQFMTVLFEIPVGKGRLWVCDLDVAASAGEDPAASLFLRNLLRAAADPGSTRRLPERKRP